MRKARLTISVLLLTILLSGCSFLGEVNNTLQYANQATDYIDKTQRFADEIPQLAQNAVNNVEARQDLEAELQAMKAEIQKFNGVEVPDMASDIHNQIESYNQKLEEGINIYLKNIKDGVFDPAVLENSGIMTTVNEITNLLNQIEKLGG
ncbi:DUF6376 family protein [Peribacillus sp. SCS-155]|uniref:DUF6376 family protein n=1 Tax=Peribacillus sedimenti TaxID=3115297 RepID=UPI0039068781